MDTARKGIVRMLLGVKFPYKQNSKKQELRSLTTESLFQSQSSHVIDENEEIEQNQLVDNNKEEYQYREMNISTESPGTSTLEYCASLKLLLLQEDKKEYSIRSRRK